MIDQLAAPTTISGLVNLFLRLINAVIMLLAGLSVLVFFKGLASFILAAGDSKAHSEGKSLMIWGTVGFFVMAAITGILIFFYDTLGFDGVRSFGLPLLKQ
jgi:hypothetical protein